MISWESSYFGAFREALSNGFGGVLRTKNNVKLRRCSGEKHPISACGADRLFFCWLIFAVAELICIQDLLHGGVC